MAWFVSIFQGLWRSAEVAHLLAWLKEFTPWRKTKPQSSSGFIGVGDDGSIHVELNITYGYGSFVQAGDRAQVTALGNITSRQGIGDNSPSLQFPPPDGRLSRLTNEKLAQELIDIATVLNHGMSNEEFSGIFEAFKERAYSLSSEAIYRLKVVQLPPNDFAPLIGYTIVLHRKPTGSFQAWGTRSFLLWLATNLANL